MTARDLKRCFVIKQVLGRKLRQAKAAELLNVSVRQLQRLIIRFRKQGPRGLIHRLRSQSSNRRLPEAVRQKALMLWQSQYRGFGPTLAQGKLAERNHIILGRETLRRWLMQAGLWLPPRKRHIHRQWRERKSCFGEMVQMDGSHHDWLEARGPRLVLMALIDDATSRVFARFYDYEGTLPAMDSFYRYARRYGLPQSLYVDRHTTYRSPAKPTLEDELAGRRQPQSQFERALTELGVTLIYAYSPQAKGRVERLFRTFQDRLVKELRLANVQDRHTANRFLEAWLSAHNHRFQQPAVSALDLHRPAPADAILKRILAIRQTHTLRNDNTLRHNSRLYLVEDRFAGRKPKSLQLEQPLIGRLRLLDGNRLLRYRQIPQKPPPKPLAHASPQGSQRRRIPGLSHPWRKRCLPETSKQNTTFLTSEKHDISIGR